MTTHRFPIGQNMLLLTATPHHGDDDRFAHFIRLIDPDLFPEPHRLGEGSRDPSGHFAVGSGLSLGAAPTEGRLAGYARASSESHHGPIYESIRRRLERQQELLEELENLPPAQRARRLAQFRDVWSMPNKRKTIWTMPIATGWRITSPYPWNWISCGQSSPHLPGGALRL